MASDIKKMAILQTTRLGDLIQTAQACRVLKEHHPEIELILIARKKFSEPLNFILRDVFDKIYKFETKEFFKYEGTKTVDKTKLEIQNFINTINEENIDVLVNLSFSKSSSYISGLIQSKQKLGIKRDDKAQIVVEDVWSQYIFSNVMKSSHNPYNLVDIFKKILGVSFLKATLTNESAQRINRVVIHPFASQARKKWGHAKWIEVVYHILKNTKDHEVVIVGGREEIKFGAYFKESKVLEKYQDRIKYYIGNKELKDIHSTIAESKLFIGHDSMVGHLAAESQTPSITISLGTVRPHETTPYQENAVNISPKINCFPCTINRACELLPCHGQISYGAICEIVDIALKGDTIDHETIKDNVSIFNLENLNIYRSYDPGHGELELEELIYQTPSTSQLFKIFYKILWSFMLSDVELSTTPPQISKATQAEVKKIIEGISSLYELYRFGATFSNQLIEDIKSGKDMTEIHDGFNKVNEINKLTPIIKQGHPILAPIIDFFFVVLSNTQEQSILGIAENSMLTFNSAQNAASVLYELATQVTQNQPHLSDNTQEKLIDS